MTSSKHEPTDEQVVAAMRAFEQFQPESLRYCEAKGWHVCDMMGMRAALRAALNLTAATNRYDLRDVTQDCVRKPPPGCKPC